MIKYSILLKPCHVLPAWMIVEGIVQLNGVTVVQEDKEQIVSHLPINYEESSCIPRWRHKYCSTASYVPRLDS
jgi:hypothetical protein